MATLTRTTIARTTIGMRVTFDPDNVVPKEVTFHSKMKGREYYIRLEDWPKGEIVDANRRVWVETEQEIFT